MFSKTNRMRMLRSGIAGLTGIFAGVVAMGIYYERTTLNEKEQRIDAEALLLDARASELDLNWKLKSLASEYNQHAADSAQFRSDALEYIEGSQKFINDNVNPDTLDDRSDFDTLSEQSDMLLRPNAAP